MGHGDRTADNRHVDRVPEQSGLTSQVARSGRVGVGGGAADRTPPPTGLEELLLALARHVDQRTDRNTDQGHRARLRHIENRRREGRPHACDHRSTNRQHKLKRRFHFLLLLKQELTGTNMPEQGSDATSKQ